MHLRTIKRFVFAGLLFAWMPVDADAFKEERVAVTPIVEGKLVTPAELSREDVTKAVLILHGWHDHMDGVGNLQGRLAAELATRRIASVRINFRGEGERNGYVTNSTYQSRIEDAAASFHYLRARFPDAIYGVQGWSLGGLISMSIAGSHPDWFQSMVLWSAADGMRVDSDKVYDEAVQKAMNEGAAVYETWTKITLTRDFLSSYIGVDTSAGLLEYPGSFLTIRGDKDFLPSHDKQWLSALPGSDKAFMLMGDADHVFNVLEPGNATGEHVVSASVSWFARTLSK